MNPNGIHTKIEPDFFGSGGNGLSLEEQFMSSAAGADDNGYGISMIDPRAEPVPSSMNSVGIDFGSQALGPSQLGLGSGFGDVMDHDSTHHKDGRLKRPMNSFLIFSSQRRRELQEQDPTLTTATKSKILGQEWTNMSEEKKLEYHERAVVLKKEFLDTNPDYVYTRKPNRNKRDLRMALEAEALYSRHPPRDKNTPKRPMNAYLLFNKECRPILLRENSKLTTPEISRTIGERWQAMTEEQRQAYVRQADEIRKKFFEANPGYVFTRQTKRMKELQLASKAMAPSTRGRKKRERNSQAPKHPMSAFLFYLVANRGPIAEQHSGNSVGPISKIVSQHWNALSPEEKQPWIAKAEADKERYARELKAFQEAGDLV